MFIFSNNKKQIVLSDRSHGHSLAYLLKYLFLHVINRNMKHVFSLMILKQVIDTFEL